MAKYIFIITCVFLNLKSIAQFGPQRIISTEADGSRIICAADVDGDTKIDILSANKFGGNLSWYKNLDGLGNFGPQHIIALLDDTIHVSAADLDGDGDVDVLAVSYFNDLVVWYENLDGQGNFSNQKIISTQVDGAFSVIAADIDGDGDLDVLSGSDNSGIAWYENLDGQGNFSASRIIYNTSGSRSIEAVDMDGDGDMDVLSNSSSNSEWIFWIENMNGLGNFVSKHVIDNIGLYFNVIYAADVDNDDDMDVFSVSIGDNEVVWYENLDGMGNFGQINTITHTLEDAWTVFASDLDNDGDIDVLSTSVEPFGGEIVWFENLDGMGSFGSKNVISSEHQFPRSVIAADIDNDGDMDVIASSQNDDKIAWYENYTILSVEENEINSLTVYPNPTKGLIYINPKTKTIISIGVFDLLGKKVLQLEGNIQRIDISTLQSGMYFLRITTDDGAFVQKIIKE
ncbi:T9SS type A sorting domain-containing protein [Aequorivita todarodis]|uniref:T9SS type A sorting domain-containing protein n=1 Tax=Aequorivita todarodis TaxID=2036821 RepID=UPI002350B3C8|nr:T9SS type A sorting domain-containing protein [Aequorivita todarodis]MDC8000387.1 T9SS type A sorting domain-containing protein [Aequorivita todarodis]